MKRAISLLLAILLCLSLLPVGALAEEEAEATGAEPVAEEAAEIIEEEDAAEEMIAPEGDSEDSATEERIDADAQDASEAVSDEDTETTDVAEADAVEPSEPVEDADTAADEIDVTESLASMEETSIDEEPLELIEEAQLEELTLQLDKSSFVSSPSGSSFTDDSVLATKLDNVFNGKVALFSNSTSKFKVGEQLGDPSGGYTVAGTVTGWQCFIYANGVYYYLFGDIPYHGSGIGGYWSNSKTVLKNTSTASYNSFSSAGVSCGAYLRTTPNSDGSYNGGSGHSIIVLKYDSSNIWFLNANRDGKNTIRVEKMTWSEFNSGLLSGRGRVISHVCTPATTKPTAPVISSVTANSTSSLTVKWNSVSGATSYDVYRRKSGEGSGWGSYTRIKKGVTGASYTDTKLEAGTKYWYGIIAVNDQGASAHSEVVSGVTLCAIPSITSITTVSSSSLKIQWNKVAGAASYYVDRRIAGDNTQYSTVASNLTGNSYTDTGLQSDTMYYYRIYAVNSAGVASEKVAGVDGTTAAYLSECTYSNFSCTIKITSSTAIKTLPCGSGTNSGSKTLHDCSVGETYEVDRAYVNTNGDTWYRVSYNNQTGYVHSGHTSMVNCKVFFNPNGGNVSTESIIVTNGSAYGTLPQPERGGYAFDGWYTAAAGGTLITSSTTVNLNSSQTLYAHWSQLTYEVAFDAQGGSGVNSIMVPSFGAIASLPVSTREGYSFEGWFTDPVGGAMLSTETEIIENTTYYAHWSRLAYEVYFDAQGGNEVESLIVASLEAIDYIPETARAGYSFDGWYTAVSGGTKLTIGTVITNNVTYYAHWTLLGSEMTSGYDRTIEDGTYLIVSAVDNSYILDIEGTAVPAEVNTNVSLYGLTSGTVPGDFDFWNVTYDGDGFYTISQYQSAENGQCVSLDVTDASFLNATNVAVHYDNGSNAQKWAISPSTGGDGYVLQAKCSGFALDIANAEIATGTNVIQYQRNDTNAQRWMFISLEMFRDTVTFDANGGKAVDPVTVDYNSTIATLPTTTRTGYTFKGWYTAKSGGTKLTTETPITANVTYYAHWTIKSYTVTFDAQGGTAVDPITVQYNKTIATLPTPTREGYTFDGWYTAKTGGTKLTTSTKITKNVTYYAQWTVNACVVTSQPEDVNVPLGTIASTTVTAEGEGLTYTWYGRDPGQTSFWKSSISTATYSVRMVSSKVGREVYCVITDAAGNTVTTRTAVLGVPYPEDYTPPVVTIPASDMYAADGKAVRVRAEASGDGLTYAWYGRDPGETDFWKSSIKTNTYNVTMVPAKSGRELYCVVTDSYGNTAQSNVVTLHMQPADYRFGITVQPKSTSAASGKAAVVSLTAEGDGLTYTWYGRDPGETDFWKSSIKTNRYNVTMVPAKSGREVYCVVKDQYGNTETSDIVTLTMFCITGQPKSVSVSEGGTARTTVTAQGDGLTYQWYGKDPGQTSFWKSSVKSATYSCKMTEAKDGRVVYCVVTDGHGNTVKSEQATLRVK